MARLFPGTGESILWARQDTEGHAGYGGRNTDKEEMGSR